MNLWPRGPLAHPLSLCSCQGPFLCSEDASRAHEESANEGALWGRNEGIDMRIWCRDLGDLKSSAG